jgi:peptidyl-prolyl cis-trans isomerase D
MAKGKASQAAVWVLLGLLILGLGGFGVTNFGGSVRSIGTVNGQDISTDSYFRALRQDMDAVSAQFGRTLSFAEFSSLGLDGQTRARLVTTALLDAETARLGLSVGDERLAEEIRAIPAFRTPGGAFDRTLYRLSLEQSSWTEAEFEARVRADIVRGVLQTALVSGFVGSDAAAQAILAHIEQTRSFSLLRLTESDLDTSLPEPDETSLRAHHAANPEAFTRPEARRITYAALLPQDVLSEVPLDEDALRAAYAARIDEFVQPERRLVERLVFGTEAQAEAARNRLDAERVTFDDLVAERGLSLDDVDMGDVSAADLGAAAEVIFAMEDPGIVGPLPSPLGPALFRMNGILEALEVSFEEAREQLAAEVAADAARRLIAERIDEVDDLLAGGATLEDLARDAGMVVQTIDMLPGTTDGIAAYPEFRDRAGRARQDDFPEAFLLADGGLVALRLDAILPPALIEFDTIADEVAAHWRSDVLREALIAKAGQALSAIEAGAAFSTQGVVEVFTAMPRNARIDLTPNELMPTVFAMQTNEIRSLSADGFVGLLRLDAVQDTDLSSPEALNFTQAMAQQLGQQIGEDVFALFLGAQELGADIRLDQSAINAVHSSMR